MGSSRHEIDQPPSLAAVMSSGNPVRSADRYFCQVPEGRVPSGQHAAQNLLKLNIRGSVKGVCCSRGRFLEGEGPAADKRRNNRFKLIPSILKSSWVVKQAVGTTPVLLGNKLVTKYFR